MLRSQLKEVLELLCSSEYKTASYLANHLHVSEKTIRLRIKELNDLLFEHGANIISKARFGFIILISDQEKYQELLLMEEETLNKVPETGYERCQYLLAYLINQNDYVKMEDLSDFLYISKSTLTNCLKSTEAVLKRYQLRIERRPNYGIRLQGSEFDIRRLMSDYFIKQNSLDDASWNHQQKVISVLAHQVKKLLVRYEIHLSEMAFENFIDYVYVAWKRMGRGHYLTVEHENLGEAGQKEQAFVKELIHLLEGDGVAHFTKDEENFVLIYLAGKRMIGNVVENDSNFVIHEKIDRLALRMMEAVSREYHIDFRNNFDARMALNQHLAPFDIRIRYGIPLKNPLLEEIKERYSLAYEMAYHATRVLKEHYKKKIPEDEIGYFALIFALELERDKKDQLSDILIVCSSGKGSSRLLQYKYEHEFSDYLNEIYVCDLPGLEHFDFTKIDYVFTTVPITKEIMVPIVEVGLFLGTDDIQTVSSVLRRGNQNVLKKYYKRERFLKDVPGDTKEEVLEYICRRIKRQEQVDDNFYDLVIERESFAQMDYGNYISIPHPNQIASEEIFAYVAILKHPIIWNHLPVQVVLLTSIGRNEDKNRQKFYEATARFALNESSVKQLISKPEYEVLIKLLL